MERRIRRIGITEQVQFNGCAIGTGALHSGHRFGDALERDHAADHCDPHRRRRRLGSERDAGGVDPCPADDRYIGAVRIEAEFPRIVVVLEQIVRPRTAQPRPDDRPHEIARDADR